MIYKQVKLGFNKVLRLPVTSQQCEIETSIGIIDGSVGGIRIAIGQDHYLEFGYDAKKKVLYLDRSKTANQSFNKNFEAGNRYEVPYTLHRNILKLQVFLDNSIAEIFVNDGERVFTAQLFPDEKDIGIELFSSGSASISYCYVYEIKSIW
jgi:sucrose-6-phosphate hydrolase SacC (GH32 family)